MVRGSEVFLTVPTNQSSGWQATRFDVTFSSLRSTFPPSRELKVLVVGRWFRTRHCAESTE
jgi:hypothetical protein